jgi:hypothetical protein
VEGRFSFFGVLGFDEEVLEIGGHGDVGDALRDEEAVARA